MKFETLAVHQGVAKDNAYNSVITPIYPTSTFAFEAVGVNKGYDYTRSGNPTRDALAENLSALEGGAHAWVTSSGMSAISTLMFLFKPGDHLIAGHDIYGGTYRLFTTLFARFQIEVSFIDMRSPSLIQAALRPTTRAIWIETPSNPLLNLVDISQVTALAKAHHLLTIADNTFLSPYFQRPFEHGVDIVVHSTTKYLNGHSDVIGGAIITRDDQYADQIKFLVNALGAAGSPFDAWLVLRGVKTLPQRMAAHQRNALAVASFLETHPFVRQVYYPGLSMHPQHDLAQRQMRGWGGIVSCDLDDTQVRIGDFLKSTRLFALAESLGGVESLIEQPWTMSHASMPEPARKEAGLSPGTIRLSVGLEHDEDLIADLKQALDSARKK